MARRTKRPAVVWLPMDLSNRLGQAADTDASDGNQNGFGIIGLDVPGFDETTGNNGNTLCIPVVLDKPKGIANTLNTESSLSDITGSAYRLRRIVGKIYVETFQVDPATDEPTAFIITAGFIILRVDENGVPTQDAGGGNSDSYNPVSLSSTADPWIWRRSWRVSNNFVNLSGNPPLVTTAPSNTFQYSGGNLDGPHVDAKTARVVSDEERLFLVVNGFALDGDGAQSPTAVARVVIITDLRVLASMRRMSGNRRNASR